MDFFVVVKIFTRVNIELFDSFIVSVSQEVFTITCQGDDTNIIFMDSFVVKNFFVGVNLELFDIPIITSNE